jgi:hypothetical protein
MRDKLEAALEFFWLALFLAATYPIFSVGGLVDQWLGLNQKPALQEPLPRTIRPPIVIVTNDWSPPPPFRGRAA